MACQLLSELILGKTSDNLTRLLNDMPPLLGLKHLAYVQVEKDTSADVAMSSVLSTYPIDWQLRYVARGYAEIDPVFAACRTASASFDWRSLERRPRKRRPFSPMQPITA